MEGFLQQLFSEVEKRLFLKSGFYWGENVYDTPFHKHLDDEVHMVSQGRLFLVVENAEYCMEAGDLLLIPAGVYHRVFRHDPGTRHSAFEIELNCDHIIRKTMRIDTLQEFFEEIRQCENTMNYFPIFPYLILVCSKLLDREVMQLRENDEDKHIISDYFSERYHKDLKLSDLAQALHLSEKQARLLIKRHTGRTFKQELTLYRMKAADYLAKNTDLSMAEIAEQVGFHSYSGFWKAYKLYQEEKNGDRNNPRIAKR